MMKEIKKIKALPLANILGAFYVLVGFFTAIVVYFNSLVGVIGQKENTESLMKFLFVSLGFALLLGLIVAIVMGILGWLMGLLVSVFYNIFSNSFGGIKLELVDVIEKEEVNENQVSLFEKDKKEEEKNNEKNVEEVKEQKVDEKIEDKVDQNKETDIPIEDEFEPEGGPKIEEDKN